MDAQSRLHPHPPCDADRLNPALMLPWTPNYDGAQVPAIGYMV
jgi:hypothetical protein